MKTAAAKQIVPAGRTMVSPYLMVESVESQIEFLVKSFNAVITDDAHRQDGFIQHGEVMIGDTAVMMGRAGKEWPARQSSNYIYVENVDETYERALKHGAIPLLPPADRPYGVREGGFADKYGNQWWVAEVSGTVKSNERDELIQTELMWCRAIESNNVDEISEFMSDDWKMIGTEGGIVSKDGFLDVIRSGDLVHNKMDFKIMHAAVYRDTATIVAKGTSAGTYKQSPFSYYEWSTSFFVKDGASWRAVLSMLTPAQP